MENNDIRNTRVTNNEIFIKKLKIINKIKKKSQYESSLVSILYLKAEGTSFKYILKRRTSNL